MIIAGIDPGIATTGFAIIDKTKKGIKVIDYGCIITTPDLCPGDRSKIINNELNKLIKKHQPKVMAVESLFFFKNLKTAMPVSEAKGVILLTAAKKKIPVMSLPLFRLKWLLLAMVEQKKSRSRKWSRPYLI